jgi:hypothetical protein
MMIAVTTATPAMDSTDPKNAAPNGRVRRSNAFSDIAAYLHASSHPSSMLRLEEPA